jgi:2-methylcitrate dehydratase PrpD
MKTASEKLAGWASSWRERGFPENVLESAEKFVLDWLASALAGRGTVPGRVILDYTRSQPEGPSRVVGELPGRSAEAAAFANGALSHIVEMDDVDRMSVVHPGAVVIPAALAVADREECSGRELLSAVIAGYEIAIRFGSAVGSKHYRHFHNTSTCGVFGSAMAAGWLLRLDPSQLVWALGNAGTMAFGLWEFNADGAMSKHLHTGHAAASGLRAADLAARGFTGARAIVEGERGFFAGLAPEGDPDVVTRGLDADRFALSGVSLKPYASCRHTHAAIDAAVSLRERLGGREVRRGIIAVYDAAIDLCDNPRPRTPYEAKFSLQYCVARALGGASMGLDDFAFDSSEPVSIPFTIVADPELNARFPRQFPARVTLELQDGDTLEQSVDFPLGDPENPLSRARVEEKLMELASYGGVGREDATACVDWAGTLHQRNARVLR